MKLTPIDYKQRGPLAMENPNLPVQEARQDIAVGEAVVGLATQAATYEKKYEQTRS